MAAAASEKPDLSIDEKLAFITRNLDEVMGAEVAVQKMRSIMETGDLKVRDAEVQFRSL